MKISCEFKGNYVADMHDNSEHPYCRHPDRTKTIYLEENECGNCEWIEEIKNGGIEF